MNVGFHETFFLPAGDKNVLLRTLDSAPLLWKICLDCWILSGSSSATTRPKFSVMQAVDNFGHACFCSRHTALGNLCSGNAGNFLAVEMRWWSHFVGAEGRGSFPGGEEGGGGAATCTRILSSCSQTTHSFSLLGHTQAK